MKKIIIPLLLLLSSCTILKYPEPTDLVTVNVVNNKVVLEMGNVQKFMEITIDLYDQYNNCWLSSHTAVVFSGKKLNFSLRPGQYNVYIFHKTELLLSKPLIIQQ